MKAKERHELATNELADTMARWGRGLRPYAAYIVIGVIVIVGAIVLYQRRKGESQAYRAETMRAFTAALYTGSGQFDPDTAKVHDKRIAAMEGFLAKYPGSPLEHLATNCLAGELYNRAVHARVTGREQMEIDADLARAKGLYDTLARRDDELGRWAEYSLACITLHQASRDEGKRKLLALAKHYPETPIEQLANQRLEMLQRAKPLKFAPPEPVKKPDDKPEADAGDGPGNNDAEGKGDAEEKAEAGEPAPGKADESGDS